MVALDRAVLGYDRAAASSLSKLLLLNVARARYNEPVHFSGVSSIAATYKFSFSGGAAPAQTGDIGALVVPSFGGGMEENPTITIAPMQGEEFTQRLLKPFEEQKLTLLLRQGYDVDSLLRLMGASLLVEGDAGVREYHNRPTDREGYAFYRRLMAHLSSIQDRHALYVEPLHFQHTWTVPADAVTPETFQSVYKDYALDYDTKKNVYRVSKRINGRVVVTNYDPDILSNEERVKLHGEAEAAPTNDVVVDIRAGHPGGEIPIHARLRLRSFHEVLTFIGRGIVEEPEFDVPSDPRTPKISENPTHSLEILESPHAPKGAAISVKLHGVYYAIKPQSGYQWNAKAFSLVAQLFQMTVSGVLEKGPAITIAK
jgi:hypothetical protein